MKEILCRLGFHFWVYPKESLGKVKWSQGSHRYCETCKLEQTKVMFGGWETDFRGIKNYGA